MTNSIEKAERAMKRREIFDRLSVGAEERMTPILSEAIDEIASRDSEIAELKAENESLLKNLRGKHSITGATYTHLIAERDQLREQVTMLRGSLLASANYIDALGGNSFDQHITLAATEHHDRS